LIVALFSSLYFFLPAWRRKIGGLRVPFCPPTNAQLPVPKWGRSLTVNIAQIGPRIAAFVGIILAEKSSQDTPIPDDRTKKGPVFLASRNAFFHYFPIELNFGLRSLRLELGNRSSRVIGRPKADPIVSRDAKKISRET
jgi:hypothetical protein